MTKDANDTIGQAEYVTLMSKLTLLLVEDSDPAEAMESAAEEWKNDAKGVRRLLGRYQAGWYARLWANGCMRSSR